MPNECLNKLRVTGPTEERQRLTALWTDDGGKVFSRILPQPRELTGDAWYEWRNRHWGTKWDVGGQDNPVDVQERGDETTIVFVTAWDPPIPVIRAMSATYPSLTFDMVFIVQNVDIAGKAKFIGGNGGYYHFKVRDADPKWIIRDLGLENLGLENDFDDEEADANDTAQARTLVKQQDGPQVDTAG